MRILYCLTHPIQYQSPLVRYLYGHGVDIEMCYASDATGRAFFDAGFGKQIAWDIPLLEGYPHQVLNAEEPRGTHGTQVTHYATQLDRLIQEKKPGAVWVHGWAHPFTAAAWMVARRHAVPLLLRGETFAGCIRGGWLKRLVHRIIFSRRFRRVSAFLAVGTLNEQLYRTYGVPAERIFRVPYAVDNAFFQERAAEAHPQREELRTRFGIEPGRPVILFCGKLIDVKDPATLIRAVAAVAEVGDLGGPRSASTATKDRGISKTGLSEPGYNAPSVAEVGDLGGSKTGLSEPGYKSSATKPILLMAGDGELRPSLEELAAKIAPGLVKFLGFQNQTELPALYDLCDIFVLPSVFEPWGLVVNEVMNAGKPVIVSDQVGSGPDLVKRGLNGDIFRAGDARDLCAKLVPLCRSKELRDKAGVESLALINRWSFEECLAGVRQALAHLHRD